MSTIIENIQYRFTRLFILLMIIETIIRLIFCLSFTNKIYAVSLTGVLLVFTSIYVLHIKKALKLSYIVNFSLLFYFFVHFVYVMGTFRFMPIMLLWFAVIPIAIRIYYSTKALIIACIILLSAILLMTQIPFFATISNHYKEIVLDHYGDSTAEFVVNFFILIIILYLLPSIYYLIQILRVQHSLPEMEIGKSERINTISPNQEKPSASIRTITDVRLAGVYQLIENHMDISECYLNADYTLDHLSADLKINKITLSNALNRIGKIPFKDLLNKYRVSKAKELFADDVFRSKNIKQIYLNVGFKYHTTFSRVFKKQEGITPSEYIVQLRKME